MTNYLECKRKKRLYKIEGVIILIIIILLICYKDENVYCIDLFKYLSIQILGAFIMGTIMIYYSQRSCNYNSTDTLKGSKIY